MKRIKKGPITLFLLFAVILSSVSFANPVLASSEGSNIAISGSFYRQHFQMLQGETLQTPDVYVVVFNNGNEAVNVQLTSQSPTGVAILLSEKEFSISAKGQKQVGVGLSVEKTATPGDFTVSVTAVIKPDGPGIVVTGGAQLQAKLSVMGEAGKVSIETRLPNGDPFQSEIHLYRKAEGQLSPVGLSEIGKLGMRLTPGNYFVQAFYGNVEIAKQDFILAANESKEIILKAQTIFIDGFSVVADLGKDESISAAKIYYSIRNIYQPVKNAKLVLIVNFDGRFSEQIELLSLPALDAMNGTTYKYVPTQWENGNYSFAIQVFSGEILYAQSEERALLVKLPDAGNLKVILIVVVIVLIIIGLILFLVKKKRKER